MTNEEAINHLKNINDRYPCSLDTTFRDECEKIALNLAIKALEEVEVWKKLKLICANEGIFVYKQRGDV